ncbi:cell envelope biogenesis protein OmpA [Streptomyces sp. TR02-1]|uniref:cell envelope biogenesis protein OmpA n=1 Tax=Streptomyces sp. TR02-1 TaxID=3385977 RepID=UPI0039A11BB5
MTQHARVPVPERCSRRPRSAGLVVPYISYTHNGHALFGSADPRRMREAFLGHLCQICGQPLGRRLWLIARPADIARGSSPEPGLHPECRHYAQHACPVLNGRSRRYRDHTALTSHPAMRPCNDPGCTCRAVCPSADAPHRSSRLVERYDAVRIALSDYRLTLDETGQPDGISLQVPILRTLRMREAALAERDQSALDLLQELLSL